MRDRRDSPCKCHSTEAFSLDSVGSPSPSERCKNLVETKTFILWLSEGGDQIRTRWFFVGIGGFTRSWHGGTVVNLSAHERVSARKRNVNVNVIGSDRVDFFHLHFSQSGQFFFLSLSLFLKHAFGVNTLSLIHSLLTNESFLFVGILLGIVDFSPVEISIRLNGKSH